MYLFFLFEVETLMSCRDTQNYSSAFNPSRFTPVGTHTCTGSHTLRQMPYSLAWWAAIHNARGADVGGGSSPVFEQWQWDLNRQLSGKWTTHSTTEPQLFVCLKWMHAQYVILFLSFYDLSSIFESQFLVAWFPSCCFKMSARLHCTGIASVLTYQISLFLV